MPKDLTTDEEKIIQYASKIAGAIGQIIDSDEGDYSIDKDELSEGDNLTLFIHALANVAPTRIYTTITGEEKSYLQFNHIANQLCFQFGKKDDA